VIPAVSNIYYF